MRRQSFYPFLSSTLHLAAWAPSSKGQLAAWSGIVDEARVCRKAQKAEGDLRRATADLRVLERERDAAESRAAAAQAEHEKGLGSSTVLAAAKRVRLTATPSVSVLLQQYIVAVTA